MLRPSTGNTRGMFHWQSRAFETLGELLLLLLLWLRHRGKIRRSESVARSPRVKTHQETTE